MGQLFFLPEGLTTSWASRLHCTSSVGYHQDASTLCGTVFRLLFARFSCAFAAFQKVHATCHSKREPTPPEVLADKKTLASPYLSPG